MGEVAWPALLLAQLTVFGVPWLVGHLGLVLSPVEGGRSMRRLWLGLALWLVGCSFVGALIGQGAVAWISFGLLWVLAVVLLVGGVRRRRVVRAAQRKADAQADGPLAEGPLAW